MLRYPKSLGEHGRKFWKAALSRWEISGEQLETLEGVCCSLDDFHNAREVLKQGCTFRNGEVEKVRPEVTVQKNSWSNFVQGCKLLGLDEEEEKQPVGRPSMNREEKRWQKENLKKIMRAQG